jgi:hypothetical protein
VTSSEMKEAILQPRNPLVTFEPNTFISEFQTNVESFGDLTLDSYLNTNGINFIRIRRRHRHCVLFHAGNVAHIFWQRQTWQIDIILVVLDNLSVPWIGQNKEILDEYSE